MVALLGLEADADDERERLAEVAEGERLRERVAVARPAGEAAERVADLVVGQGLSAHSTYPLMKRNQITA